MSKKNAIQKLPTKLPILKNPVIHGIKYTDSIYDPEWGFHREQNATDWSTTPNPFRCRMRKNADGTRIVFELYLRPEQTHAVVDNLVVVVFPVHVNKLTGHSVTGFSLDTHHRFNKEEMLKPVTVPVVVDLVDQENPHVECTSVTISVTMSREDGAYDVDVSRFKWYFGKAAVHGPRPAHMPLHIQQQMRNERKQRLAGALSPDYASTAASVDETTSSVGKAIRKVAKKVFSAPLGAGIPNHFAPQPYEEDEVYTPGYPTNLYKSPGRCISY